MTSWTTVKLFLLLSRSEVLVEEDSSQSWSAVVDFSGLSTDLFGLDSVVDLTTVKRQDCRVRFGFITESSSKETKPAISVTNSVLGLITTLLFLFA